MSERNDGGPAFPVDGFPGDNFFPPVKPHKGMTLRDYFAGQALVGILACPNVCARFSDTAGDAYRCADAMLAARGSQERDSATGGAK